MMVLFSAVGLISSKASIFPLRRRSLAVLATLVTLTAPLAATAEAGFRYLGEGGELTVNLTPNGMTGDGAVVVGDSYNGSYFEAFRWTLEGGPVGLGDLPGGTIYSVANDVSADGSVVIGRSNSNLGYVAMLWTSGGGMVDLGQLSGTPGSIEGANGISTDGTRVAGYYPDPPTNTMAYVLSVGDTPESLGDLPGGSDYSEAKDISATGSHVVGRSHGTDGYRAFRWTAAGGIGDLGGLPIWEPNPLLLTPGSWANAVSADGAIVAGSSVRGAPETEPFRWTSAKGMVGLGFIDPNRFQPVGEALAVSADGSIVVGYTGGYESTYDAFIWDEEQGIRELGVVLAELGVVVPEYFKLDEARCISDDGKVIAGVGTYYEPGVAIYPGVAWIVELTGHSVPLVPSLSPTAMVFLVLGLVGYAVRFGVPLR